MPPLLLHHSLRRILGFGLGGTHAQLFVSHFEQTSDEPITHYFCFLKLDAILPGCTSSVPSDSHCLSILRNTPRTHPPRLSKPAFRFQAVRVISSIPLTSNRIIVKPTSDGRSPRSRRVMAPVSASCDFSPAITAFLTGAPFPLRIFGLGFATGSAWCRSFTHRVESKGRKESSTYGTERGRRPQHKDSKRGATAGGGRKLKEREARKETHALVNDSGVFLIRCPKMEILSPNVEVAAPPLYLALRIKICAYMLRDQLQQNVWISRYQSQKNQTAFQDHLCTEYAR